MSCSSPPPQRRPWRTHGGGPQARPPRPTQTRWPCRAAHRSARQALPPRPPPSPPPAPPSRRKRWTRPARCYRPSATSASTSSLTAQSGFSAPPSARRWPWQRPTRRRRAPRRRVDPPTRPLPLLPSSPAPPRWAGRAPSRAARPHHPPTRAGGSTPSRHRRTKCGSHLNTRLLLLPSPARPRRRWALWCMAACTRQLHQTPSAARPSWMQPWGAPGAWPL